VIRFSIFILFFSFLNASIVDDYKNKRFDKICNFTILNKYKKDEKVLSLMGEACLNVGRLYMLPYIVKHLQNTPTGRKNGIYFLVIYNEKKLLYSFLFDSFDIGDFCFPKTDYFLSIIFEAVKNKKYKKKNSVYLIRHNNEIIKMYKKNDKMVIEISEGKKSKRYYFK
jgi:hypothetical protein